MSIIFLSRTWFWWHTNQMDLFVCRLTGWLWWDMWTAATPTRVSVRPSWPGKFWTSWTGYPTPSLPSQDRNWECQRKILLLTDTTLLATRAFAYNENVFTHHLFTQQKHYLIFGTHFFQTRSSTQYVRNACNFLQNSFADFINVGFSKDIAMNNWFTLRKALLIWRYS